MDKLEKILAWQLTKVRNKKEVIAEAGSEGGNLMSGTANECSLFVCLSYEGGCATL